MSEPFASESTRLEFQREDQREERERKEHVACQAGSGGKGLEEGLEDAKETALGGSNKEAGI